MGQLLRLDLESHSRNSTIAVKFVKARLNLGPAPALVYAYIFIVAMYGLEVWFDFVVVRVEVAGGLVGLAGPGPDIIL